MTRLAVGIQQSALGRRRQGRLLLLSTGVTGHELLDLAGEPAHVHPSLLEQGRSGRGLGERPEQVLGVHVGAAPLPSLFHGGTNQIAGLLRQQPGQVHALHR